MRPLEPLSPEQQSIYEWQMWSPDFGARGQQILSAATVLVTRVGGLGGLVAYELAAAGIGKLILAHGGNIRPSDLNRQILMTHAALGTSRVECARRRLLELNPKLEVVAVPENISPDNIDRWAPQADILVDCAPRFSERFVLNDAAQRYQLPLVECAMYDLEGSVYTVIPGTTACVRCLYPQEPAAWRREFPVFGAVSGMIGCLGAMETIKQLVGFGQTLQGTMLRIDLRTMQLQQIQLQRDARCLACGPARIGTDLSSD